VRNFCTSCQLVKENSAICSWYVVVKHSVKMGCSFASSVIDTCMFSDGEALNTITYITWRV
jgi:hypothetical protein